MEEDIIRQKIEQADPDGNIPQVVVEELVESMKTNFPKVDVEVGIKEKASTEILREEMNKIDIKDWRSRASLAAKIISINLS